MSLFMLHARIVFIASLLVGVLGMAGWVQAATAATQTIEIKEAWARWLPGVAPAGGYLTLVNAGDRPMRLVRVSSADYGRVSIHRTHTEAGASHMMPVQEIAIAAHASVRFASEGYHLMLEQPKRSLAPGDRVALTLGFDDGSEVAVSLVLSAANATGTDSSGAKMRDMPGMTHP